MVDSPKQNTVSGVGLLSSFHLMHYTGDTGFEVGVRVELNGTMQEFADFSNGIQLSQNVKLRFSSKDDFELLSNYPNEPASPTQYCLNKYVIECSFKFGDETEKIEAHRKIRKHILIAVAGLRLLKRGYIDSNTIMWIVEKESGKHASLEWQRAIPSSFGEPYYLRTDEISKLNRLIRKISKIDFEKRKSLKIALNRFENSYYNTEDEGKLIDYMISFEALFTEGEGRSQRDVISVACSMLLGKTQKEREKIRDKLDYAYNIRNAIVHGADFEKRLRKEHYFNEFVLEIEELLRKSIVKLL